MLEFKTNQLKSRKTVTIDDHVYTVRKLGNIEKADLDQYMARLDALSKAESASSLNEKQAKEVEEISKRISELFIGLFDDHGDQSKSRKLVSSFSENELDVVLRKIFNEGTVEETLNGITPDIS